MENKDKNVKFFAVCVALITLQAGFGAYGVIYTKLAKGSKVEPLIFCFYRDGGCAPVLFILSFFLEKKLLVPQVRELPLLIFLGFSGIFFGQLMYIIGLINTTPDTASMLTSLTPIVITTLSIVLKIEKTPQYNWTGFLKIFGIILAVIGALFMTHSKQISHTSAKHTNLTKSNTLGEVTSFGLMCVGVHVFSKTIWILSQKKYVFQNPNSRWRELPINLTAWSYFFGALWMAIASFTTYPNKEKYHIESMHVVYCLLYAIFVTSALCYVLLTWCNMQVNPSFVSASYCLHVLFTVTFSYIVLGETLSMEAVFAGLIIISAMLMVTWSNFIESSQTLVPKYKDGDFNIKTEITNVELKEVLSRMWKD